MNDWERLISDLKAKVRVLRLEIEEKRNKLAGLEEAMWDVEAAAPVKDSGDTETPA